jgi:hypothetical protein
LSFVELTRCEHDRHVGSLDSAGLACGFLGEGASVEGSSRKDGHAVGALVGQGVGSEGRFDHRVSKGDEAVVHEGGAGLPAGQVVDRRVVGGIAAKMASRSARMNRVSEAEEEPRLEVVGRKSVLRAVEEVQGDRGFGTSGARTVGLELRWEAGPLEWVLRALRRDERRELVLELGAVGVEDRGDFVPLGSVVAGQRRPVGDEGDGVLEAGDCSQQNLPFEVGNRTKDVG